MSKLRRLTGVTVRARPRNVKSLVRRVQLVLTYRVMLSLQHDARSSWTHAAFAHIILEAIFNDLLSDKVVIFIKQGHTPAT